MANGGFEPIEPLLPILQMPAIACTGCKVVEYIPIGTRVSICFNGRLFFKEHRINAPYAVQ